VQYVTLINWIIIGTEIPRIIAPALLRKPQALDWLASFPRSSHFVLRPPFVSLSSAARGHAKGAVPE
jgi:hypothetical protein